MKNDKNENDRISKGGFNFTFSYTNEKTYGEYVEECFRNVDIEELIEVEQKDQAEEVTSDKDYKVSSGGFNFTFSHTGNKTYGDYIRECLSRRSVEELKNDILEALADEEEKK